MTMILRRVSGPMILIAGIAVRCALTGACGSISPTKCSTTYAISLCLGPVSPEDSGAAAGTRSSIVIPLQSGIAGASMWLLHTTTFVLRKFVGPSYPPYAILSHRWQAEDQTYSFQSVRAVSAQSETPGQGPALSFPGKVRNFCALAANECYEWAWLDTCCIDKTSSAELSEATNSMYAWYEAADICYVYLFDVCDEDNPFDKDSHFRKSEWRKRGWTLQELLAPKNVVFLSKSWYLLGTLPILATLLAEITGVDLPMLHQKLHGWRTNTGVAQRMSWAARRTTSRPEDRAYSLMGIFGVSMPVIYGEGGERAFLRLQKEMINVCPDQSIFAWGLIDPDFDAAVEYLQRDDRDWGEHMYAGDHRLLATSPYMFKFAADFRPLALSRYFQLLGHRPDYNYRFGADGITLRLPISSDCLRCHSQAVYAAALACTTATNEDIIVFLFLGREVAPALQEWTFNSVGRLVGLDKYVELTRNMWDTVPRMRGAMLRLPRPELAYTSLRELRIRPPDTVGPIRTDHLKQLCGVYLFEIPHWVLSNMKDRHGFAVPDTELAAHLVSGRILYTLPTSALYPYLDAHRFLSIPFINAARNEALLISFGLGCLCLPLHKSKLDTLDHRAWWLEASLVPGVPTELPQHAQVPETPRSRSPTPTDELEKPFFRRMLIQSSRCSAHHIFVRDDHSPRFVFPVPHVGRTWERTVHVSSSFRIQSETLLLPRTGRFTITIDLVGFDTVEGPARPSLDSGSR